jgi:hypothetical protein
VEADEDARGRISGLIAFAGLTIGGIVAYIGDGAVAVIRHWLKIN